MALWYKNIKNNDIFTTDTHSRVPRASKNLEDIFEDHFGELECYKIQRKLKKNQKKGFFVQFWQFFTVSSILAES